MKHPEKRRPTIEEATKPIGKQPDSGDQAWNDEQTRQAIKEADAGDFATSEEMKATVRKFVPNG